MSDIISSNKFIPNIISFHGPGGDDKDEDQSLNIILKILSIFIILGVTVAFGFFPYFNKTCRTSVKILGLANSFSGGIFLGIALFHLLPESVENIEHYFEDSDKNSRWNKVPISYLLAFMAFALILFIEKIAFDSHSLIDHGHGDGHGHDQSHSHGNTKKVNSKEKELKENLIGNKEESDSDSDIEEETMKNVVTSRGKFSSFLQLRNSMIEREKGKLDSAAPIQKQDKALLRASLLLKKTLTKSFREPENEDLKFMVNPKNVHVDNINSISPQNPEEFKPKSVLTPFLLLVALSMHGFFEGLALGIQGTAKDSIFLFIAIISHKWAEAFTLGISFTKANTSKATFILLITVFALFTPLGITLGLILSNSNKLVEGIVLGVSTGTFIYVAASEVIVEEFAVTKYKYIKFIFYLLGGIFVGILALLEKVFEESSHDHDH